MSKSASSYLPNLAGETLDEGRISLVEIIGSGSNGVIYLAIDNRTPPDNPTKYAVKVLPKAAEGSNHYERQKREILCHEAVSFHPNIVTVHWVVEDDIYFFLIMDYCPGGDLFSVLYKPSSLRGNVSAIKDIYSQLLDAVDACHRAGVYHRDIKPENVLLSNDHSTVYLCDFGLATTSTYSLSFGAGSSFYMSPECICGGRLNQGYSTRANDIWALGVVLTSMISGHNPWQRAVLTDDCYSRFVRRPDFLRDMLPISASANRILQLIFYPRQPHRVVLPKLRQMIADIDTFFMTPAEIASSNCHVRKAAASYFSREIGSPVFDEEGDCQLGSPPASSYPANEADIVHRQSDRQDCDSHYSGRGSIRCVPRKQRTNSIADTHSDRESSGPATPQELHFKALADHAGTAAISSSSGETMQDTRPDTLAVEQVGDKERSRGLHGSNFLRWMATRTFVA